MKYFKFLPLLLLFIVSSCSSIKVTSDYDTKTDFSKYKTFAFYKKGIDRAKISDIDKKRIMRAVEKQLALKGIKLSKNPDMLVSIFTKSRQKINIRDNRIGVGFGYWNPWYFNRPFNQLDVNQYTEGTLFVDFIDTRKKSLVWQGVGSGALKNLNAEKKEERINEFVKQIIDKFPPEIKK